MRHVLLLLLLSTQLGALAQSETTVETSARVHDYGDVLPMTNNVHEFEITNTGDTTLFISDCKGTCGCTIPECPKRPIKPGEKSKIKVIFHPKEHQVGLQEKQVLVFGNIPGGQLRFTIKANVREVLK